MALESVATENGTLCFDHLEGVFLEFREIGPSSGIMHSLSHDHLLAHGGGANFGCNTTNYQRLDTVVLQNQM